jgi:non-specific serine/threonine protein kinase
MAAGDHRSLYVVGGYVGAGQPSSVAAVLRPGATRWRLLPPLPEARAAAGAAVAGRRLYVVGGVAPGGLARRGYFLDLRSPTRWRAIRGPTPREHLAVAAYGGRIYAIGGRLRGIDTNLTTVEAFDPRTGRWSRLPPLPEARGGTGAATVGRRIVSIGGEQPGGTIASVYVYDTKLRLWQRLPDLPSPRHGLGVAAVGQTVYAVAGGPEPGLFVSRANESLGVG